MLKMIPILVGVLILHTTGKGQELYVFTEPASNMPSKSISAKVSSKFMRSETHHAERTMQRYMPEIMFGLSKKWMVHAGATFSDMYTSNLRYESVKLYAKYRFLSIDEVHAHFRMALFADASHSVNPITFDELGLDGDQSGVQGGLVATQLWHKLAVSTTLSYLKVTTKKPTFNAAAYPYSAFNYTASAGYLLLPFQYTSYKQTNVNLYAELLGQQTLDRKLYYVDLAPALQFIFNSNAKVNVGYRFQLNSNMQRMSDDSWLVSFEYVFLNALRKKKHS
jgi:hypothetical protein